MSSNVSARFGDVSDGELFKGETGGEAWEAGGEGKTKRLGEVGKVERGETAKGVGKGGKGRRERR